MLGCIWSGAISFGLVMVACRVVSTSEDHTVCFRQYLLEDMSRVRDRLDGLVGADALKCGADVGAVGETRDRRDGVVPAFGDHVGDAELLRESLPVRVTAERDDPAGAGELGGKHG